MDTVDVTSMCPYDQAKARALLAEAGYSAQKPLTFELAATPRRACSTSSPPSSGEMARIG
jgi:hypothetical protein